MIDSTQADAATTREPIVGIDLGTTNSLVAYCDEAGPRILASTEGEATLPSVVRLSVAGEIEAIGSEARRHAVEFPERTIFSVKRLMGRGIADVQDELDYLPYEVVEGQHVTARVKVGECVISPPEISARMLAELKRWAEHALGREVHKAVVTVPAYFDDAQRQATRDAGRLAGLDIVRIVNEPTAAALAYGIGRGKAEGRCHKADGRTSKIEKKSTGDIGISTKLNPDACTGNETPATTPPDPETPNPNSGQETIAVYDLGGGTFDVSILRLQHTEQGAVDRVLATTGDTHLGGDDVDRMIVERMQHGIREQFGRDLEFPAATRQAFRNLAEATKIRLSNDELATIEIDLGERSEPARPLQRPGETTETTPPRTTAEELTSEGGEASGGGEAAGTARLYHTTLTRNDLEDMIRPWAERTIDIARRAVRKARLEPTDIDRVVLVGGSTRIPLVGRLVGEFFETEPYTALDPDQVVALGASVQAAILAGVHRDRLLLDVIPLSLGIETMGGAVAKLITANTTIPARATETFTTYADHQTGVQINVYQGERELVQDCRLLGRFELQGIPPMPAGLPKVEVTFLVDANGVLSVHAVEERSGKRASIQLVPHHGLTREEVDRIEAESFEYARDDMTRHRLIDLRMNARLDIRQINKQLDRIGDRIEDTYREKIEQHVATVQSFIDAKDEDIDPDAFAEALTAMDHATVRLAEMNIARTLQEDEQAGS
jgi:molecular chaperone DnaK